MHIECLHPLPIFALIQEFRMKKIFTFLLMLFISFPALSQEKINKFTTQDFLATSSLSSLRMSPDGSLIVYVLGEKEKWDSEANDNLWLISTDGTKRFQLTNSEKTDWNPQWSPDGSMVAFLSDRSGQSQVHVISICGGESQQVTFAENGVDSYKWIDNTTIACVSPVSRDAALVKAEEEAGGGYVVGTKASTSDLWIQSLTDKNDTKNITDGTCYIMDMCPSPDGKYFVMTTADNSDLYNQITKNMVRLIDRDNNELFSFKEAEAFEDVGFSPDGTKISFTGNTVGYSSNNSLFVYDLKTKELENLTEKFDPTMRSVQWLDSETITFLTLRRSYTGIYRVALEDNDIQALLEPYFVTFDYAINPATDSLCFYGTRGQNPSKLYVHRFGDASSSAKAIYSPNEWITEKDLASTKVVRYASYDGYTIEAVLTLPPHYDRSKKYPLMVLPHGGPDGMSLDDFGLFGQLFAQEGMVVFEPNFRGGIGFGSEMYRANRGRLGDIDYKDIMAGVDHLIKQGIVDPERLVVGGWSYGGYMTNWIIGHTNRFKAAVSVAGIANTVSMYAQSDINHGELARWEFKGVPVLNIENFRRSSPIEYLQNCKTPTLILHGEADKRVPVAQAWEIYRALNDLGVEVQMVLYPGAGHGISAPKQFVNVMSRWVEWYKRFIKERPAETPLQ
jgi:dipeptidyl aminopeptidase/acylaminoacyl peptidase